MLDIREEQLSVNVNDKVEEGIIDIFKAGNTVQLPVIDDNMHVIGIVDIYDVIANMGKPIEDIMIGDVEVAGKDKGVFSFKNYRQDILPIVDADKKLKGFVNKNISKVYLPNR